MATVVQPTTPLNKAGLIRAVAAELGVSRDDAQRAVDAVLNTITRTLAAGHSVTVTNFGSWHAVDRPERAARNPQTGDRVTIPARRAVRVRVAPHLQKVVRTGAASASIRKRPSH
jgi:nucleoid DNA-binding protein